MNIVEVLEKLGSPEDVKYFIDLGYTAIRKIHMIGAVRDGIFEAIDDEGKQVYVSKYCTHRIFDTELEAWEDYKLALEAKLRGAIEKITELKGEKNE